MVQLEVKEAKLAEERERLKAVEQRVAGALEQLVQEQGTALDYLSEALRECQSKPPEIVEKKVEVEVPVPSPVPVPVPCPTTTTTTTVEPSTEEKLEQVAERVENGVTDSIRGFAEALAAANEKDDASEAQEEAKEEAKDEVKPKEDSAPPPEITKDLKKLQEHLNLTAIQGPTNAARARPRRHFLRAKVS